MTITVQGQVTDIFPAEIFGNFEKRVMWVREVEVQYPNHYSLEFHQGNANLVDNFVPGDMVKCSVDVKGRKWEKNGKSGCMNTLVCWRIERVGTAPAPTPSTRQQTGGIPHKNEPQQQAEGYKAPLGPQDDLPF